MAVFVSVIRVDLSPPGGAEGDALAGVVSRPISGLALWDCPSRHPRKVWRGIHGGARIPVIAVLCASVLNRARTDCKILRTAHPAPVRHREFGQST